MHLAVAAADHGDRRRALRWLFFTFVLGPAFLVNLGFEWGGNDFSLSSTPTARSITCSPGSTGCTCRRPRPDGGGGRTRERHGLKLPLGSTFTISAYYWHFVDAVWICVFLTISWCDDSAMGRGAALAVAPRSGGRRLFFVQRRRRSRSRPQTSPSTRSSSSPTAGSCISPVPRPATAKTPPARRWRRRS